MGDITIFIFGVIAVNILGFIIFYKNINQAEHNNSDLFLFTFYLITTFPYSFLQNPLLKNIYIELIIVNLIALYDFVFFIECKHYSDKEKDKKRVKSYILIKSLIIVMPINLIFLFTIYHFGLKLLKLI